MTAGAGAALALVLLSMQLGRGVGVVLVSAAALVMLPLPVNLQWSEGQIAAGAAARLPRPRSGRAVGCEQCALRWWRTRVRPTRGVGQVTLAAALGPALSKAMT